MANLEDYALFVSIAETGSISAAALQREQSVQSASRALNRLESSVGTQLVARTTRSLTLTSAGRVFFERIRQPVFELEQARARALDEGQEVAGELRVGAPVYFGSSHVAPLIARFAEKWRSLRTELVLTDRYAHLLDDRLDLAIRIGVLPDSNLRARRLARLRRVIFAAPKYLDAFGRPALPDDLAVMPCVVRTFGPERDRWPFTVNSTCKRIQVHGVFFGNDATACNEAVAVGVGVGMAPYWQVRPLLDTGRVELLLQSYEPPLLPLNVLWHGQAGLPARSQLFMDSLVLHFGDKVL